MIRVAALAAIALLAASGLRRRRDAAAAAAAADPPECGRERVRRAPPRWRRSCRASPRIRRTSASWSSSRLGDPTGTPASSRSIPATTAIPRVPVPRLRVRGRRLRHRPARRRRSDRRAPHRVGGIPIEQVLAQVEPLVPHDNETTGVELFRGMYLLNEEVLDRLGIAPTFDFTLANGERSADAGGRERRTRTRRRSTAAGPGCGRTARSSRRAERATRVAMLAGGRASTSRTTDAVVYTDRVASPGSPGSRTKAKVRRVVVDLRNNLGGDNNTYPPLIAALQGLARKHKRIVVLAGRWTFLRCGELHRRSRDG